VGNRRQWILTSIVLVRSLVGIVDLDPTNIGFSPHRGP
jgi:hypothetical protein